MTLRFTPEAENALLEIALWVEERNTPGSGSRFASKFIDKVSAYALPNVAYAICRNSSLAALGLRCVNIGDWVVAFRQTQEEFTVHYIIHGSGLS